MNRFRNVQSSTSAESSRMLGLPQSPHGSPAGGHSLQKTPHCAIAVGRESANVGGILSLRPAQFRIQPPRYLRSPRPRATVSYIHPATAFKAISVLDFARHDSRVAQYHVIAVGFKSLGSAQYRMQSPHRLQGSAGHP
ncbi:hypothetical protein L3Y34_016452 [Caenorhabditis briggsae]|uniref:Uncharacterized protein n=1 Tax=Caenorhabditis briggsae TaxID=6238 RepID=A0AAE9DXN5_CAEBR|nr:hypothetical protein L3Y34_016452 [Caenorhabditis briggsae]